MSYFSEPPPRNLYGLPKLASLRSISPQAIGALLLRIWQSQNLQKTPRDFATSVAAKCYGANECQEAARLVMEGTAYLIREGHLVRDPSQSSDFYILSRSGRSVEAGADGLPGLPRTLDAREILHPFIENECVPEIERGSRHFSDAIFKAFKRVEIVVREKPRIQDDGVKLMRAAFRQGGALAEQGVHGNEVDALMHLFAGAIGRFKNPGSHRDVVENDVKSTMQLLAFASFLLAHVERVA